MEEEKQKARRHVQVPNSVSTNLGSDKKSKTNKQYTDVIIYGFLRKDMVKETMTAFVSLRNIAAALQMSVGGITAAVKRLEEAGDIIKVKSKGGKSSNGYQFNPHSDKFEMFDHAFLDNTELSTQNKAFYMLMQPHLYLDAGDGIGKTTYSDIKISELTGISKTVVRERRKELEKLGFVTKRLTTDVNGHSCEALEFNLLKFQKLQVYLKQLLEREEKN